MSAPVSRTADHIFSDIWLPEETRAIRDEVRAFADRVIRPIAHDLNTRPESRESFPRAAFTAMAEAGLYEIPFDASVGGRGLQYPTLATMVVLEELAYFSPGLASALFDGQAILVGKTLEKAQDDIRLNYLGKLVRGEIVGSFATSEPAASTDLSPACMMTTATPVAGGYELNGQKRWITNSVAADILVVLTRTGEKQTMFLVDMKSPGISVGEPDAKMGNHAQLTADIFLDKVFVPESNIIGTKDSGLKTALSALTLGRMGIGAVGVAMAQAAFDIAADYMKKRKVFGQELARFQHWQFRFAEHAIAIENARNLYYKAAYRFDKEGIADVEAAMCKVYGSGLAVDVARDAIQVCGAYGFVREVAFDGKRLGLESIYRDAKIGEIYEGANEIQKWIIARNTFGREITG